MRLLCRKNQKVFALGMQTGGYVEILNAFSMFLGAVPSPHFLKTRQSSITEGLLRLVGSKRF